MATTMQATHDKYLAVSLDSHLLAADNMATEAESQKSAFNCCQATTHLDEKIDQILIGSDSDSDLDSDLEDDSDASPNSAHAGGNEKKIGRSIGSRGEKKPHRIMSELQERSTIGVSTERTTHSKARRSPTRRRPMRKSQSMSDHSPVRSSHPPTHGNARESRPSGRPHTTTRRSGGRSRSSNRNIKYTTSSDPSRSGPALKRMSTGSMLKKSANLTRLYDDNSDSSENLSPRQRLSTGSLQGINTSSRRSPRGHSHSPVPRSSRHAHSPTRVSRRRRTSHSPQPMSSSFARRSTTGRRGYAMNVKSIQLSQALVAGDLDSDTDSEDEGDDEIPESMNAPQENDEGGCDTEENDENESSVEGEESGKEKKSKSTLRYAVKAVNKSGKLATKAVKITGKAATKTGKLATKAATKSGKYTGKMASKAVTNSGKYAGKAMEAVAESAVELLLVDTTYDEEDDHDSVNDLANAIDLV